MLSTSSDSQTLRRHVRMLGRSLLSVTRDDSLISVAQTRAPSSANAMAVARPMPCPAAVTRATFPASLPLILNHLLQRVRLSRLRSRRVEADEQGTDRS